MLIEYVYDSVKNCKLFDEIIIATSKNNSDKKIVDWCKRKKIKFYTGSLNNVSKRFYDICKYNQFDYFLRVCADSPLLDMRLVKSNLKYLKKNQIVTNCLKKTFPKGQSIESFQENVFLKIIRILKKTSRTRYKIFMKIFKFQNKNFY